MLQYAHFKVIIGLHKDKIILVLQCVLYCCFMRIYGTMQTCGFNRKFLYETAGWNQMKGGMEGADAGIR